MDGGDIELVIVGKFRVDGMRGEQRKKEVSWREVMRVGYEEARLLESNG